MEGKEVRFGIVLSALFAVVTTAASCGAVNAMHDSFTALGGMIPLIHMQVGEIIVGGVGAGLYGMLLFVVIAIFVAGLMVGRTPEYPGIPPEARNSVFDVFCRVRAGDKQAAGTGLGLSICSGLIEAHGGGIEALPGPAGRGTTIAFWLPVQPVPPIASPDEDEREPDEGSRPP
jgi:hypothetical protein